MIQEVIGAQQFVIAEYLTRVLLRSVQEVIRLQHFDISKEAERLGATVTSESGWNRKNSALFKYFRSGVSVTAGAAHVYNGAPHIHNKSWWDDTVLYPALMSGYTLGEALFANQLHIGWITTFIGDPLLRYSQAYKTSDNRLPVNPEQNVRFRINEENLERSTCKGYVDDSKWSGFDQEAGFFRVA